MPPKKAKEEDDEGKEGGDRDKGIPINSLGVQQLSKLHDIISNEMNQFAQSYQVLGKASATYSQSGDAVESLQQAKEGVLSGCVCGGGRQTSAMCDGVCGGVTLITVLDMA